MRKNFLKRKEKKEIAKETQHFASTNSEPSIQKERERIMYVSLNADLGIEAVCSLMWTVLGLQKFREAREG